jgi:hypothetical protein
MKRDGAYDKEDILHYLSHLPKKILSLKGHANAPEFVLHELCNPNCFNLSKAAFFVDSPDFDHFKGVAGFVQTESYPLLETMWQDPTLFSQHMEQAPFNQKVRNFSHQSIKRRELDETTRLQELAQAFDFHWPVYHKWDLKHDNHGFLIYENNGRSLEGMEEYLNNSLYLFGFCPIF